MQIVSFSYTKESKVTSLCSLKHDCSACRPPSLHMGAACVHAVTHVLYLQQSQPLLIVEPLHSCPEPANHYVVVMVTWGEIDDDDA